MAPFGEETIRGTKHDLDCLFPMTHTRFACASEVGVGKRKVRRPGSGLAAVLHGMALVATMVMTVAEPTAAARANTSMPATKDIPKELRPWVSWVLHGEGEEQLHCPLTGEDSSARACAWPAQLTLDLDEHGGRFTQTWHVYKGGAVLLPGDDEHWPSDVRLGNTTVAVTASAKADEDDAPSVFLAPGIQALSGRFAWDSLPDALAIPKSTGLLALKVNGKTIAFPQRDNDENGRVFLGRREQPAEADAVEISVHRKLVDEIPLLLTTRLQLAIAGKNRELTLGKALPDGFEAQHIDSPIPLRIDADGRLHFQARAGTFSVEITARRIAPTRTVMRPRPDGLWKAGQEVWVFEQRPALRLVDVHGAPAIDPAQTSLPDTWKSLPAYSLDPGATITLDERRRGVEPSGANDEMTTTSDADELSVTRQLWLDFDGGGFTSHDEISALFRRSWRLEAAPGIILGRVAIDGYDQFITHVPPGEGVSPRRKDEGNGKDEGVEIRRGHVHVAADARIEGTRNAVSAVSFRHTVKELGATLMIPPGWRLFHVQGADKSDGTWVDAWSLVDVFILLITTLAAQRLFGWGIGALAFVAVGMSINEPEAPAAIWLAVLLGEALIRTLGRTRGRPVVNLCRLAAWSALLVMLLPFAVQEFRRGVHPASEGSSTEGVRFMQVVTTEAHEEKAGFLKHRTKAAPADGEESTTGHLGLPLSGTGSAGVLGLLVGPSSEQSIGLGGLATSGKGYGRRGGNVDKALAQIVDTYDPTVVVQTGPGLPRWEWRRARLSFNGPVKPDQTLRLYWATPAMNVVLSLLRIAFLGALAFALAWRRHRARRHDDASDAGSPSAGEASADEPSARLSASLSPGATLTLAFFVAVSSFGVSTPSAHAEVAFPPSELLDGLKARLLTPPPCHPDCGSIARLTIDARPRELHLVLETAMAAPASIALPGGAKEWSPSLVRIDGKAATALRRDDAGVLWLALPAGTFHVDMSGPLPARDTVTLPLPARPHYVANASTAKGWTLDGVHEDGVVAESISLLRAATGDTSGRDHHVDDATSPVEPDSEGAPALSPFFRIERTLHLGLRWEIDTTVTRVTPTGAPVTVDIPTLPGESVTTPGLHVAKGGAAINVSLGPDDNTLSWHSTLTESRTLRLFANPNEAQREFETWRLDLGPTWHATWTGLAAIRPSDVNGARIPEWRPWPGESVTLQLTKPEGAAGQTLTIDRSSMTIDPGARQTHVHLDLEVRSSRASTHAIQLEAGATLESIALDGVAIPVRLEKDGRTLVLPVAPRKQQFDVAWIQAAGIGLSFQTPTVDLGIASTNTSVHVNLSKSSRWILWLTGPRMGPAVHFWSVIFVLAIAALALGRLRMPGRLNLTPLRARDWLLLGLGLAQSPPFAAGLVAALFLGAGWRKAHPEAHGPRSVAIYKLTQILFVGLTLTAIAILASALEEGLMSTPDMGVLGNLSTDKLVNWYQDRAGRQLPVASIVSAPLWIYRTFMLGWALWLALACLRWSRWLWQCFRERGLWSPLRATMVDPTDADTAEPSSTHV